MATFLFTCPKTAMKVQQRNDDDRVSVQNEYEALTCPACSKVHFINRKTGKLFSEDN